MKGPRFESGRRLGQGAATLIHSLLSPREPSGSGRPRLRRGPEALALLLLAVAIGVAITRATGGSASAASSDVVVQVDPTAVVRQIPNDYLGLSIEYWSLENYAGKSPRALN